MGMLARRVMDKRGVHDGQGYGTRNVEGERILEFCEAAGMIVWHTV